MSLNWSYFKPEFTGKPQEDPEVHLIQTRNWMDTHNFAVDLRVRRFPLTLAGKGKLWHQSIHPFQGN